MRHFPTAICFHKSGKSPPCLMFHLLHLLGFTFLTCGVASLYWHTTSSTLFYSSALGFNFNMTKRDSFFAGIDSPRAPTSMQRRHLHFEGQSSSGATFSGQRPQPGSVMGNLAPQSLPGIDYDGSSSHYGYTATAQSVPLPDAPAHQTPIYNLYVKKPTHSRLKLNNSIEFSIPTLSQRSVLLINQKPVASW